MLTSRRLRPLGSLVFALALGSSTACNDALLAPAVPDHGAARFNSSAGAVRITAMTRNLYIGTDVVPVFAALASPSPLDDLPALLAGIAEVQETSYPARAEALADEIASARPHVIGLQEVSLINIVLPPFLVPPAGVTLQLDFLAILQGALAARGLNYAVASSVTNTSVALAPAPGAVVSVVDKDVIIVDTDRASVVPGTAFGQTFANNIGPIAPGITLLRGYAVAQVIVGGTQVSVANTHLESGPGAALTLLRAAQAAELVGALGAAPQAIVLGDLNEGPGSPMHQVATAAGFLDSWADMRPGVAGLTCCHVSNLSNANAIGVFDQRIDYVMVRGLTHPTGKLLGSVTLHGTTPDDRVPGPTHLLWPSDHAGLSAEIVVPPAGQATP